MAPPEDIFRMKKGLAMAGIPTAAGGFPEAPDQFLPADIPPPMLNVAFITYLIQDHGLFISFPPFGDQFRRFVRVNPLDAAVGYPGLGEVIERDTVVDIYKSEFY
mgnify:CR=1 FL=1